MTPSLLRASWRAVAHAPLVVPVALSALMITVTVLFLGAEHAERMRVGVAAVLACALATTAEDPTAEVAAASPHPRWMRCAARLSVGVALVLPTAVLAVMLLDSVADTWPGAALQMLAVLLGGPAIGFALWAWADLAQPAYAAMIGALCWSLAIWALPAAWGVVGIQPWGPPWDAVLIRWAALILFGLAIVLSTWRDPLTRDVVDGEVRSRGVRDQHQIRPRQRGKVFDS